MSDKLLDILAAVFLGLVYYLAGVLLGWVVLIGPIDSLLETIKLLTVIKWF